MRERPILFSGPLVRDILDGRKAQTRRVVTPQPPPVGDVRALAGIHFSWIAPEKSAEHREHRVAGPVWAVRQLMGREPRIRSPYGRAGDRLWVRETFCIESGEGYPPPHDDGRPTRWWSDGDAWEQPHYRATDPTPELVVVDKHGNERPGCKWTPSIFMRRWQSRIVLEVTDVRIDQLQAITDEDAIAEGVRDFGGEGPRRWGFNMTIGSWSPRSAFAFGWDRINGKREGCAWRDNPWVWVVSFAVLEATR